MPSPPRQGMKGIWYKLVLNVIWILGLIIVTIKSSKIFEQWPIDIYEGGSSDIIPQIGWMVKRLLDGEFPYRLITAWPHHLFPTYQTFQWVPFTIAEVFNFDYRWIPFVFFSLSLILFQKQNISSSSGFIFKIIFSALPWILLEVFINHNLWQYAHTVETLIVAYYLLFLITIFHSSIFLKALATVLCLLSRYSIVLWLPLFFLSILYENKFKARNYAVFVICGIALFYVLPFMLIDPMVFNKGYAYHTQAAYHLWSKTGINFPHIVYEGVGVAGFFYDFIEGDTDLRLTILKRVHLILLAGFMILSTLIFIFCNKRIVRKRLFLLGTLKIYLAIFYSFLQLPFHYLFIVPLFVSLFFVFKLIDSKTEEDAFANVV